MKYNIMNITKSKVVLAGHEAQDAAHAAGKYISVLMLAGIVRNDRADVVFTSDTTFSIPAKGWDFAIEAA